MGCCQHRQGLERMFDCRQAAKEAAGYRKNGIDKVARAMVRAIADRGLPGASILEVGAGIGGLHLELLKRGAARAIDVDLSPAYLQTAQHVAEQAGLRDRIEYRQADFATAAAEVPESDIIVLHRVICCYPDMPGLVGAAALHTRRLLALSYPRDAWWARAGAALMNLGYRVRRHPYRFYIHPSSEVIAVAAAAGLAVTSVFGSGIWQIALFERAAFPA